MVVNWYYKQEDVKVEKYLLYQDTKNNYPKCLRVLKRKEFLFSQKGTPFFHDSMTLVISKNNENYPKFGVVVSKKVGNAVIRNYYKRILRVFFRTNKPSFSIGFNYIVIPKENIQKYDYKSLLEIFLKLVKRSNEEISN